jgi:hypothetical protein
VIDNTTGATIESHIVNNPGETVSKSFTGVGNNRQVQVTVDANFQFIQTVDARQIEAVLTTR